MPQTLRKGVAEMGHQPGEAVASPQRVSLADRLERARERGRREARRGLPSEERERIRREAFGASPLLRGHADELLAITGELARVLPSHAEYQARTNGDWGTGATGPSSRSRIENPACTFVWEIKHNPQGMLNQCPVREYNWALENTNRVAPCGRTSHRERASSRRPSSSRRCWATTSCARLCSSARAHSSAPRPAPLAPTLPSGSTRCGGA